MDKDSNPQVLTLLDIVSKSCAENLEPFLESHLMKTELMMELMAHFQFNILVRIAAKCQVCMHHFVFFKNARQILRIHVLPGIRVPELKAHMRFPIVICVYTFYTIKRESPVDFN